jgi:hypothetical protein
MRNTPCRACSTLVVLVGALALSAASTAGAQRAHPVRVFAAQPAAPQPVAPSQRGLAYPRSTLRIGSPPEQFGPPFRPAPRGRPHGTARAGTPPAAGTTPTVVYVPVPNGYPAYPVYASSGYGGGGGVYDTNGRPLYAGYDDAVAASAQNAYPVGTPDLSGSPYVVVDGGAMLVDFGNGDRRTVSSCAVLASAGTPSGQSRTIFYRPAMDGVVLRAGQRGRVLGAPTAGARVCYTVDAYGRMVLAY